MLEFRIFEQGDGWSEWKATDVAPGGASDSVCYEIVKRHTDHENPDASDGNSLTQTDEQGRWQDSGIAMMKVANQGLICVEYRRAS